jgi:hypothetical protein
MVPEAPRVVAVGVSGRHAKRADGRDLSTEVASAIDRVLGRHAKRPAEEDFPQAYSSFDDSASSQPLQRITRSHQVDPAPAQSARPDETSPEADQPEPDQPSDDGQEKGRRSRRGKYR